MKEKVFAILAEYFDEPITDETRFQEDLDADSLTMIDISLSLRDIGVHVNDKQLSEIKTVGDLLTVCNAQ